MYTGNNIHGEGHYEKAKVRNVVWNHSSIKVRLRCQRHYKKNKTKNNLKIEKSPRLFKCTDFFFFSFFFTYNISQFSNKYFGSI